MATGAAKSSEKIGEGVRRQALVNAYQRRSGDPVKRPLRVFTLDSTTARVDGSVASIEVPWEPLGAGPEGSVLVVDPGSGNLGVDLDSPRILIRGGLDPSVSDELFHQQMVYAVCAKIYAQFREALGRVLAWGFDRGKLYLHPHADGLDNAFYDPSLGEIRFGSFPAQRAGARIRPSGKVFTCLSHDIIAHEFTHALVDGLRSHFTIPTSNDVLGFHEGFADLIALFQHFTYPEVLEEQIRRSKGKMEDCFGLASIAEQFGQVTTGGPLRCAITKEPVSYRSDMEPHEMGGVLVSAVCAAFAEVYQRKVTPFIAMAYGPPSGYMVSELVTFLAEKAAQLASQFLHMGIRALDYCPPFDLQLGEYLRAMITADRELVPSDPWGYRDALIGAFAARGVYPPGVDQLSEDALVWRPPQRMLGPVTALHFANLRFAGDPSLPANADELSRQAMALWEFVTQPHVRDEFGLAPQSEDTKCPCIESIRTSRRAGPDGEVLFDLVAEITQQRTVIDSQTGLAAKFFGGCTVIIGPEGEIRYVVSKSLDSEGRLVRQLDYQRVNEKLWKRDEKEKRFKMAGFSHQLAHRK
jgi:hypothetical protein